MNRSKSYIVALLVIAVAMLSFAISIVYGAGGQIEGKVTDPKGAVVAGAKILVTDPVSGQTFNATTDNQGHYQITVPAGSYYVIVSATGFTEFRRESVTVPEGAATTVDVQMEIAPVEAAVTVSARSNNDAAYQELRRI
jgi:hypothetical protein